MKDKKQEEVYKQRIMDLQKENESLKIDRAILLNRVKELEEQFQYGQPDIIKAIEFFKEEAEEARALKKELKDLQHKIHLEKAQYQAAVENELEKLFPSKRPRRK